jgi:aryl-alcohol dehydrogenase-like predicted oxidoreductase
MEGRRVGESGVRISVVGLGGAWLGHYPDDVTDVSQAVSVIQAALEAGVSWLDTSENYYDTGNEALIGAALRQAPDSFLVCTKVAPGAAMSGGGSGFRPEQIHNACRGSLRRLSRDHLDIYLLHWPDDSGVPLEDTWGAMAELARDGLVRAIGMSNYPWSDIESCHAQRPVDVIQTGLSLIDYLDDRGLIARCGEHGIAVTIYEPVANGILTDTPFDQVRERWIGSPWEDSAVFRRLLSPTSGERSKAVVDGLRRVAAELHATVAQVAIAWVLRQPGVTSAIAGSGSVEHTVENAGAANLNLSDAMLHALDELIPLGPSFATLDDTSIA